jgi:hypothetical protein
MKDTLQFIVTSIVDQPEDVIIDEENNESGLTNFIITANKEDIGKIIGKNGKIIRAIRNIMKIKAMKQDIRINISIADSEKN